MHAWSKKSMTMCDKHDTELSTVLTKHHHNGNGRARGSNRRTRSSGEEAAWTASRCNRILRTIDSRIAILQRLSNSDSSINYKHSGKTQIRRASVCTSTVETEDGGESPAASTPIIRDSEWLPGCRIDVKKPRKTYTAKHRVRPALQRGNGDRYKEVCFNTPFVKQILQPKHELDLAHRVQPQRQGLSAQLHREPHWPRKSRQLPLIPTSTRDEAEKNLQSAFRSMLIQTQPKSEASRTGSRSLMDACLRKVPSYIELLDEEDLANTRTTESKQINEDNSNALYVELEGLGCHSGWPQLREVVRAHCIHRLCESISHGILPVRVVDHLVDTCASTQAVAEGQQIIEAMIQTYAVHHAQEPAGGTKDRYCVTRIKDFTSRTSSEEFEMRFLTHLLRNESAYPTFETTDISSHWKPLVQALLLPSSFGDAAILFETLTLSVLKAIARAEPKNRHHSLMQGRMLYSTVVLISATVISGLMEETVSLTCRRLEGLLKRVHLAIHTHLHEFESVNNSRRGSDVVDALTMSILLVHSMQSRSPPDLVNVSLERALDSVASTRGQSGKKEEPFHAIGDIARCVSRFDMDSGSQLWKHMINSLLSTFDDVSAQKLHIVQGVALESAEEYDATHCRPGGSSFAAEIEAAIRQYRRGTVSKTPVSRRMVSGFRWDAGLCEFVARTPFPLLSDSLMNGESPEFGNQDQCPEETSESEHRAGEAGSRTALAVLSSNTTRPLDVRACVKPKMPQRDKPIRIITPETRMPKCPRKRSITEARTDTEEDKDAAQPDCERDELGIPTPAVKKRRRQAVRASTTGSTPKQVGLNNTAPREETLGHHTTSFVDLSDDELGA